ncbi:MAG: hypothetical protein DHS20C02_19040 [Micavibrio sp.]|nr:MAG: hypothetical protein DHS20C02_19040 [Micavibrio sp.]
MKTTKTLKTLILGASVLAIGLGAAGINNQAHAAQGSSQYVENVDIDLPGMAAVVNIENAAANKHINALDLDVQESKMDFEVGGLIKCDGTNMEVVGTSAHFGPVNISGAGINSSATLHSSSFEVSEYVNNDIPEYVPPSTFSVPLNKVKNGNPALRVDPLAELEKARQAFNGTDLEFYKHDREIVLQRPLSVSGACRKQNNTNKVSSGYETKNHVIQIKYKGDPALNETPVLNAQLGQGNMPNQLDAGEQPLNLGEATFQPNMPHYFGKCLPDNDPKIRVNWKAGGEGHIRFMIEDAGNPIYGTEDIPHNGDIKFANYMDIYYPLKAKLPMNFNWNELNKTFSHPLKIRAQVKDKDSESWGPWKDYGTATWKHRCEPQLNPNIGGQGHIGGYGNGGGNEPLGKGMVQAKPQRGPLGKVAPAEPAPRPKRAPVN